MRFIRSKVFLFALLAVTTAVLACSSDSTDPMDEDTGGDDDDVVITLTSSLTFSPSNVTIAPGTTVRWVNGTSLSHTVTPTGHSEWAEWATSSQGQTFEHIFGTSGTFDYHCEPHFAQGMTGTVTVQ